MKKIDIFCDISSLGMTFPKENKNHIGYFDIVKSSLSNDIDTNFFEKNEELGLQFRQDFNFTIDDKIVLGLSIWR